MGCMIGLPLKSLGGLTGVLIHCSNSIRPQGGPVLLWSSGLMTRSSRFLFSVEEARAALRFTVSAVGSVSTSCARKVKEDIAYNMKQCSTKCSTK